MPFPSLRSLFTKFLIDLDHWVCFVQLYNLYHVETEVSFRYSTKQLTTLWDKQSYVMDAHMCISSNTGAILN